MDRYDELYARYDGPLPRKKITPASTQYLQTLHDLLRMIRLSRTNNSHYRYDTRASINRILEIRALLTKQEDA